MTWDEKVNACEAQVESFIGDVMEQYADEEIGGEAYEEAYAEEVWVLAIDFVNLKGWDSMIAHKAKERMLR